MTLILKELKLDRSTF